MSYTVVLQEWTRVAGAVSVVVLQPEPAMLDISPFQDVTFYTEVADVSNVLLKVQTAPIKEEAYFSATGADLVSLTPGAALLNVTKVRWETATVPPARWLRWRATNNAASPWSVVFRITASLNPGGSILSMGNGGVGRAPGAGMAMSPPGATMMRR
jgi:hypothetical protein